MHSVAIPDMPGNVYTFAIWQCLCKTDWQITKPLPEVPFLKTSGSCRLFPAVLYLCVHSKASSEISLKVRKTGFHGLKLCQIMKWWASYLSVRKFARYTGGVRTLLRSAVPFLTHWPSMYCNSCFTAAFDMNRFFSSLSSGRQNFHLYLMNHISSMAFWVGLANTFPNGHHFR